MQFCDKPDGYEEKFIGETRKLHEVTTGPMWRVTVMPTDGFQDESAANEGFKFQYQVLIGFHHAITDGHSSMRICGFIISLLNDVIEGKDIDDGKQLAEFVNDSVTKSIEEDTRSSMKANPAVYEGIKKRYLEFQKFTPMLFQVYPGIESSSSSGVTDSVQTMIPKDIFGKFYAKSKSLGITVHSAFCSAVHAAIIDILIEAQCKDEQFDLTSSHDINFRRYWSGDSEFKFGPHVGLHRTRHVFPRNMKDNFWIHAENFHKVFNKELEENEGMKFTIVETDLKPKTAKTAEEFITSHEKSYFNYGISNMGDVTRLFKKSDGSEYKSARIVNVRRTTSMPPGIYCSTFCIQTLNGNLLIAFDFQTRYYTPSVAQKLLDNTVRVIKGLV